jgi:hypothetical protein
LPPPDGCLFVLVARYLAAMQARSWGSRRRLMWRDVFGWNLGLSKWGNTAAAEVRLKCDLPLLPAAVVEAEGWIYF